MSLQDRQLGRYRILEPLGSGGMSVVYRGHDTLLARDVAVKVLHPHLAGKSEARRRLAQEAQAVARLRHPNILEVYDFSTESSDQAYLITEYIRGQTLRQFLETERLDPPEVAALVIHALAGALATAHEAGVIHRDLKPDNVMVREDGVLKLMDFGIAKVLDRDERMTMTGALMGSPAHMAPEVIEGEPVGAPADIFSLGTMFYLLVTGSLPFLGPNPTATLKRIVDGSYEDPLQLAPALSRPLAAILTRTLERRPEDRYAHAAALRDALTDALLDAGIERPDETLSTFFSSPPVARQILTRRLVEHALERAEQAAASGGVHAAIDLLNQVQALEPENARALALLGTLSLAQRTHHRRRTFAAIAGGTAALLTLVAAAWTGLSGTGGLTDRPSLSTTAPDAEPTGVAPAASDPGSEAADPSVTAALPGPAPATGPGAPASRDEVAQGAAGSDQPGFGGAGALPEAAGETGRPGPTGTPETQGPAVRQAAGLLDPAATPSRPRPAASERPRPPPAGDSVPVEILIRPWAYVAVDDGPFSATGLQTLRVQLAPGPHTVRLRCPFCEDTEETISILANGRAQTFALSPALKPARLAFDVSPAGAVVEIDGVSRPAVDTLREPFLFRTPKGERPEAHDVRYTVSLPGYAPRSGTVRLNVGQEHIERAALDRP